MAVEIARTESAPSELRSAAGRTRDGRAARRMLAIALALEGADRANAARSCGMDRQTLRDRARRYNSEGLPGLYNRPSGSRPRHLSPEQSRMLAGWIEDGPDPARDGVVRWRCADLKRRIAAEFGVKMHERTVGKYLAALGYTRLTARPRHPKPDPQAQEAFKKTSPMPSPG